MCVDRCAHVLSLLQKKRWSFARSATFPIPRAVCAEIVNSKLELAAAAKKVFADLHEQEHSKAKGGVISLLTRGHVTRTDYYTQAVRLAFIPFLEKELFPERFESE